MNLTIVYRFAIALALGLIIGMERGWQTRQNPEGSRIAGIRSFGFVGLLGAIAAVLAQESGAILLALGFLGLTFMVSVSYGLSAKQSDDVGITTELSLLLTFALGALAGQGFLSEALATSVIVTVLLGFKQELHHSLEQLDRRELIATLKLLIIWVVALPLLPDLDFGPWNAINPRKIGLLVLLIAGISYVGYFAMRWLGDRVGILATAIIGALVSSTAVTVAFGRMARSQQGAYALLGAGISLAAGTMAVRILVEVAIVNSRLLPQLILPIAFLAVIPLIAAWGITTQIQMDDSPIEVSLKNPIELSSAIGYAALLTGLFVLIHAIKAWFGDAGIYLLSAISGVTDVDAVSLSLAQATRENLPLPVGAAGILIAAIVNTAVKAVLATAIGGWKLAKWCATILCVSLIASLSALLFIHV
jgi:uncharacterized membrane protein (DUF4010 family)